MFLDAALLHYTQISALPNPESNNLESLRDCITRPGCGNYSIAGAGSDAWGDFYEWPSDPEPFWQRCKLLLRSIFGWKNADLAKFDLVATQPQQNVDAITRWIFQEWVPFIHGMHRPRVRIRDVEEANNTQLCSY